MAQISWLLSTFAATPWFVNDDFFRSIPEIHAEQSTLIIYTEFKWVKCFTTSILIQIDFQSVSKTWVVRRLIKLSSCQNESDQTALHSFKKMQEINLSLTSERTQRFHSSDNSLTL